jgi:hypothetical protein
MELLDLPENILVMIFTMLVKSDFKMYFHLNKIRNRRIRIYLLEYILPLKFPSLHLAAFRSKTPIYPTLFDRFTVNGTVMQRLKRHFQAKIADGGNRRPNRKFKAFLRFIFENMTGLVSLTLEHREKLNNVENGFHRLYFFIYRLVERNGQRITDLRILGGCYTPHQRWGLQRLVAVCSENLCLAVDDFDKFIPPSGEPLQIRSVEIIEPLPLWRLKLDCSRFNPRFPILQYLKLSIKFNILENGYDELQDFLDNFLELHPQSPFVLVLTCEAGHFEYLNLIMKGYALLKNRRFSDNDNVLCVKIRNVQVYVKQ